MNSRLIAIVDRVLPRRRVKAAAIGLGGFSAIVLVSSVLPGAPFLPTSVTWPVVAAVILLSFRTARLAADGRIDPKHPLAALPARWRPVLVIVMPALVVITVASIVQRPEGVPERHGDTYFLRNHTQLTPVTRNVYRAAEAREERAFAAVALFFCIGLLALNTSDDGSLTPGQQPRAMPRPF